MNKRIKRVIIVITLLLVVAAYLCSYFVVVEAETASVGFYYDMVHVTYEPQYHGLPDWLYAPAHCLDRTLWRSGKWETNEKSGDYWTPLEDGSGFVRSTQSVVNLPPVPVGAREKVLQEMMRRRR